MNNPPAESMYSRHVESSLKYLLKFELKSLVGRKFLNRRPPLGPGTNYLNLGCGANYLEGFINADFFVFKVLKSFDGKLDWMVDLRYPLNCAADCFDGILAEHLLEHLYPYQGVELAREMYRVLKPGGWLRVSVPDLAQYIGYYCGDNGGELGRGWESGCEAIWALTQIPGHYAVFDARTMGRLLEAAGFVQVKEVKFREGTDPHLLVDLEYRRAFSLYMEAQKPLL